MKIISLTASNLLRLRAVEITPDGNIVIVSGKNGAGKTSTLNALWAALEGAKFGKANPNPVREGADGAEVRLDLGDIIVTRTWSKDGRSELKVENALGIKFGSPQGLLDSLIGRLSFDPLAFASLKPKEQVRQLLDLIELPFDPIELDEERKTIFDERTIVNREVKALVTRVEALPEPDEDLPAEEISSGPIFRELENIRELRNAQDRERQRHERAVLSVETAEAQVADFKAKLAAAEQLLARSIAERDEFQAVIDGFEELDTSGLEQQLADLEVTNAAIREQVGRREMAERAAATKARADDLTRQLDEIDTRKADALAAANMPIEGLGFEEGYVTFEGVPFQQASAAEQLRVSMAMAAALNPEIRVVRVTDASLLDSESMGLVRQMAEDMDVQVWLEVVADQAGDVGVHIEDGEVVAIDGEPV